MGGCRYYKINLYVLKKEKKNVLIVTAYTWPYAFGGGRNALNFTHYLNSLGFNALLVSYKGTGKGIISRSVSTTLQVAWFNKTIILKLISILWIAPIYFYLGLISSTILIVGAYNVGTPFVVLGAKLLQRKIVFRSSLVGEDDPYTLQTTKSFKGLIAQSGIANCNIYHAINPGFSNLVRHSKYKNKSIITVSQGINTNRFNSLTRVNNKVLKTNSGGKISIVSAGLIIKRKGYKEIIDLLTNIEFPFSYTIVTNMLFPPGFNNKHLTTEATELINYGKMKLGQKLCLIESCEKIEEVFLKSDIILHNSFSEGTPNVIMEAMACGVVPVVRELLGFRDFLIHDEKNGFLYSDIEDAGRILNMLYKDKSRIIEISQKASDYSCSNFSYHKTWGEIQKALTYA